jgi:hypothetical protein
MIKAYCTYTQLNMYNLKRLPYLLPKDKPSSFLEAEKVYRRGRMSTAISRGKGKRKKTVRRGKRRHILGKGDGITR